MNNKNKAFLASKDTVTIVFGNQVKTLGRKEAQANGVFEAIQADNYERALELADRGTSIRKRSEGNFVVQDGLVFYKNAPLHNIVTERILEFIEIGLPFQPLLNFLEKLMLNPSRRAVEELYRFLEHRNMPVTEDGDFVAYKAVSADYKSKYCGRENVEVSFDGGKTFKTFVGHIPNNVGAIVKMDRNLVSDDARDSCSVGLHAGSVKYATGYAHGNDHVVLVKINPKDVVSVPFDCEGQKLRNCGYEVLADFSNALTQPLVTVGREDSSLPNWHRPRDSRGRFARKS